jgi:hypothetical protein
MPKTNLVLDVISEDLFSFPDALQLQVCSELPHCVTFRLFALVFTKTLCLRHCSYAVSDPIANWFSVLDYFRSCCLYSDYSVISWLYVFALITSEMIFHISTVNQVRHSLWPSLVSYVLVRFIYFLSWRSFVSPALCMFAISSRLF